MPRKKIVWKQITLEGWNGDMEKQLEAEFILKKRYCAVSIARASDLESKFNVKVASDLGHCDPSRKKCERSFLPSELCSVCTLKLITLVLHRFRPNKMAMYGVGEMKLVTLRMG